MSKDFNVKITVRNGRLLREIRKNHDSVAAFARRFGLVKTGVNSLVTMAKTPVAANGDWRKIALDVATALGVMPGDIWPDHMQTVRARRATAEMELDQVEVASLASPQSQHMQRELLERWSERLTPRETKAIEAILDGTTFDELGQELGEVTPVRARQIQIRALRKMREAAHRDRIEHMSEVLD